MPGIMITVAFEPLLLHLQYLSSSPYMADKEPRVATNEGTVASMGRGGNPHHLKDEFRMTCAVADSSLFGKMFQDRFGK
ncbi:unnamed protein product [Prunus armeniaca]|uniref:Uncharacterized protein n=1 Tax=Prunus armeniaca TaxID=36596 RepID=A0A6J5UDW5_PRUAR|nr:unnamed protein product [Prunus armeniaca]